ncbi:MAG: sugar phosphate isomerase/epimerase [Spirochaetota bacterium]
MSVKGSFKLKGRDTKIAAALYNVRDYSRTAIDLDQTLRKISAIGFKTVQISGIGPIPPVELKALLDKHGLYACSTHESLNGYRHHFDEIVEKLERLGCTLTTLGYPGDEYWVPGGAAKLALELNEIGRQFNSCGIRFGYHNHDVEFTRFEGTTFLQALFDRTDPEYVCFEIDTHWVQRGGGNPAAWIRKAKGRIPVLHIKDYAIVDRKPQFAEIGEGNLDWEDIFSAGEEAGVRWYVVEQDNPLGERDIFESLKISYDNLKGAPKNPIFFAKQKI